MSGLKTYDLNLKIVIAWRFFNESIARIYQSRLNEVGIESFLSNHHTTNLIPFGDGGVLLHVKESDLDESLKIIKETYSDFQRRPDEDFRDADLGDIEYERNIQMHEAKLSDVGTIPKKTWILLIVVGMMMALLISYLINFF